MSEWNELTNRVGLATGWIVAHAVWQTALLALVYAVWQAHARRVSLSARHHAAYGALALGVAAAVATGWVLSRPLPVPTALATETLATGTLAAASVAASSTASAPALIRAASTPAALAEPLSRAVRMLALIWTLGLSFLAVRLLGGWWLAVRIRRRARPVRSASLLAAQHALTRRLGLRGEVPLLESCDVDAPVTMGWRRPVVLVPRDRVDDGGVTLAPLLAHELAHVRHGDYAANLVQTAVDALFFLCPGARWLSARVRAIREYRCDDLAVAMGDRGAYARALAHLAATCGSGSARAVPSAAGPRLAERIRRLSRGDVMSKPCIGWNLTLVASIVATASTGLALLSTSRVLAAPKPAPPAVSTSASDDDCPLEWAPWRPGSSGAQMTLAGNELVPQGCATRQFHCNPLQVDGRALDRKTFGIETRGQLTVVHGDPRSGAVETVEFKVSLRREGALVAEPSPGILNRAVERIDLATVMALARVGDELIIDPVRPSDWRAKRIIRLGGC
jgi:beta-lactamase regulating signal transducer with metallopeptidase domain